MSSLYFPNHTHMQQTIHSALMSLQEAFERALGPCVTTSHTNATPGPANCPTAPQSSQEGLQHAAPNNDPNTPLLPFEALNPPAMYSNTTEISDPSSFNARASWLAGKPVHGNAFLTHSKIRHTGWLVPAVVVNSDFTLDVFWQWVHGLLPEVEHVNRAANALISRLPSVFRWVCVPSHVSLMSVMWALSHKPACRHQEL